ncbi:hypothetical protein PHAVU_007G105000 [Phaseolus vulgaris]|uniref:Secreted protein n=1 Tax=Phaseolus vulgaris TaxID=3885 RepID=V7BH76_PHAVU|nr:hypothetical protein PHAVU_007G105000g [Phaseolus vulgaris]ESW15821.1 hypothetical protein PHAVU_007G105000g [Phaseolus vulgaris]
MFVLSAFAIFSLGTLCFNGIGEDVRHQLRTLCSIAKNPFSCLLQVFKPCFLEDIINFLCIMNVLLHKSIISFLVQTRISLATDVVRTLLVHICCRNCRR